MIAIGNINYEAAEIEYSNKDMKLKINSSEFERGELIITKSEIAWKKEDGQGFSIPWEKIVVQAISAENQRSIYFMIDCAWPGSAQNNASNGGSNNHHEDENVINEDDDDSGEYIDCEDEESEITEFWLKSDNPEDVDNIYFILTRYPQVENMQESDEDFFDGEDMEQMNINDRFADD